MAEGAWDTSAIVAVIGARAYTSIRKALLKVLRGLS
jgi:hypothetical protein